MPVTKRTRFEVLKRDDHTCRYCGATAPDVTLTVDHVTPQALGGSDDPSNLVAACRDCNAGKGSTAPDADVIEDVKQADLRWAEAFRRVAAARAAAEQPRREYVLRFSSKWASWHYSYAEEPIPRDSNWRSSIERFHDVGVPIEELERLVDVACANDRIRPTATWRYFCGCVWRYVNQIREEAAEMLTKEDTNGA